MRRFPCLIALACILACDSWDPKSPTTDPKIPTTVTQGTDSLWGDTSLITDLQPHAIANGLYKWSKGYTPNPAGGPSIGPAYQYLEIHNSRAKRGNARMIRSPSWDSTVCYFDVRQNKDSILLLEPDGQDYERCGPTYVEYAVFQDDDSIGLWKMEVYKKDSSGTPGLWRTDRYSPEKQTMYILLEKDSISFNTLEKKFPYRASGDSLYYTSQYGESSCFVKYFEGLLLFGSTVPTQFQKM